MAKRRPTPTAASVPALLPPVRDGNGSATSATLEAEPISSADPEATEFRAKVRAARKSVREQFVQYEGSKVQAKQHKKQYEASLESLLATIDGASQPMPLWGEDEEDDR